MVSKRWQRTQSTVAHAALAVGAAIPFYLFEQDLSSWTKIAIIILGYIIIVPFFRWLHRQYANTFVKVYRCEYENAARIVQRTLNAERFFFTKRLEHNQVVFKIRPGNMELVVEDFLLNMMVDDHLAPEDASKLTLERESPENAAHMKKLRLSLDQAFAAQGW